MSTNECYMCNKEWGDGGTVGALSCGHCFHIQCFEHVAEWLESEHPEICLRCPTCSELVEYFTPLYLHFPYHTTIQLQSNTETMCTTRPTQVINKPVYKLTVEGAHNMNLNGNYEQECLTMGNYYFRNTICKDDKMFVIRRCTELQHSMNYHNVGELVVPPIASTDEVKYWYITGIHKSGCNINYYYVPIDKSCLVVPPSTGWICRCRGNDGRPLL